MQPCPPRESETMPDKLTAQTLDERVARELGYTPYQGTDWNGWAPPGGVGERRATCELPSWSTSLDDALRDLWPELAKAGWTFILYRRPAMGAIGCIQPYDLNLCSSKYVFATFAAAARLLTETWREMKEGKKGADSLPKQCLVEGVDDYPDDEYEMRESEKEGE